MTFDLNKRVEQLLDDSDLSEPHEVADKVIAGLSRTERPVAFREAMTAYVRTVMGNHRRSLRHIEPYLETPGGGTKSGPTPNPPATRRPGVSRYHKAALAGVWRGRYRGVDRMKPLGEFSVADAEFARNDRLGRAATHRKEAERFGRLIEVMTARGVERAADLGDEGEAIFRDE